MASRTKSEPAPSSSVGVEETPSGDYALGATIGGVFYPFVTASRAHVEAFISKASSASSSSSSTEEEEG